MKIKPSAFILKDKERYIIASDTSGTFRVFLEIDYHAKKASIFTSKVGSTGLDLLKEFVFVNTDPRNMQIVGNLISAAGKVGKELLTNDIDKYQPITNN